MSQGKLLEQARCELIFSRNQDLIAEYARQDSNRQPSAHGAGRFGRLLSAKRFRLAGRFREETTHGLTQMR